MGPYIVRRLFSMVVMFFLISIVVFLLVQLPQGDFVDYYISQIGASGDVGNIGEIEAQLRSYYGLDRSIVARYFNWISDFITGDFGYSLQHNVPVVEIISQELGWTLLITFLSLLFAWIVGIPLGIYSAIRRYTFGDHFLTFMGLLGVSIPSFFLALVLLFVLLITGSPNLGGLFSEQYLTAPWSLYKVWDLLKHIWLPVVVVGTSQIAQIMRLMRSSVLDVVDQPFVKTARSKGITELRVIFKHVVRVALNPLISLAGMQAPQLISGLVATAVVLALPVMGPTFLSALRTQDVLLATAYLQIITVFLLVGNLIADIALGWSDPRIRFE